MNIANDPYIRDMIAAHRAGLSVYAIAKACGMGWRTVKRIVQSTTCTQAAKRPQKSKFHSQNNTYINV